MNPKVRHVSVITIDRARDYPEGVYCIKPGKTPVRTTYKEAFTEAFESKKVPMFRNDIALVNLSDYKDKHIDQLAVYPGRQGPSGSGWECLSPPERNKCVDINNRMLELADKYPEYAYCMRLTR